MRRCGLNGSDAQHCEDRSGVDPVKRCAATFVSPWHRTLKSGSALPKTVAPLFSNIRLSSDAVNSLTRSQN